MIAIAESGSTKTEWTILNRQWEVQSKFRTEGFNPYFYTSDVVAKRLTEHPDASRWNGNISWVYFYGAGCSSEALNGVIVDGLSKVFSSADIIVDHDLLASAYSLYNDRPVISCILGTGSNSAYFDGRNLEQSVHALGYILGDEGGGAYFGKRLLADYFYNKLPEQMMADFQASYNLEWSEAVKNVYGNPRANVYLASFMPFLGKHKDQQYTRDLLAYGFEQFINIHVLSHPKAHESEVGFVGSIASVFEDILLDQLKKHDLQAGKIIKNPINELVDYHKKYLGPQVASL